jgi:glycosyltransferase involved in cell wall biosynthesis
MKTKIPKISVIIPAHNEEGDIARALDSVILNNYDSKEIIVVNDGSTDKTEEIAKKYSMNHKFIKLINYKEGHSAAFARNRGAEKAKGDILVFLDADTSINSEFLKIISEDFDKFEIQGIGNPKRNSYTNLLSRLVALLARPPKGVQERSKKRVVSKYIGFNTFIISRKIFLDIGKYDEKIFYYEDEDLSRKFFKYGNKGLWEPKALFYSYQPSSWRDVYRQCAWSGKGIANMVELPRKMKEIGYSLFKLLFIISPFIVLFFDKFLGLGLISLAYILTYFYALRSSKELFYSILMVPLMYLRNIFEFYAIFKFLILGLKK